MHVRRGLELAEVSQLALRLNGLIQAQNFRRQIHFLRSFASRGASLRPRGTSMSFILGFRQRIKSSSIRLRLRSDETRMR